MQHSWLIELAVAQTAVLCKSKEAEGKFSEAIECLQALNEEYNMGEEQQAVVNIQLGNYSYRMEDFASAVQRFQEATRLAVACDGDERLLLTCLANLERALSKTGRDDEAAQVQQYRLTRLADFARESSVLASSSTSTTTSSPSPWREPPAPALCHSETSAAAASPIDEDIGTAIDMPDWLWAAPDVSQVPAMGMT
jgi:tetratricopeptide (TPR) repeat protein